MQDQNIYDNEEFFKGYSRLRSKSSSANTLVEKPALFSLCPDFKGKTVLDLGCGYGENCRMIAEAGAKQVIGIDISENMLKIANAENRCGNNHFLRMSMQDIASLDDTYDIILSSLALHYIEDFNSLMNDVSDLLKPGGVFIFSQEHPLTTALPDADFWIRDEEGNVLHYNLRDYGLEGKRESEWIVQGVIKYHRTFSSILNALSNAGLCIERVLEPIPDETIMKEYPVYEKYKHKPDFLLVKAVKPNV